MHQLKQSIIYILLLSITLFFSKEVSSADSDHFVTTWNTTESGQSSILQLTIPTVPGLTYDYSVDWDNDGVFDQTGITGDVTHSFTSAGVKTIRITGLFPRIFFNNNGDRLKIYSIDQWGTNPWTSMRNAFYGAANIVNNASDTPNLTGAQNLHGMFHSATNISTGTGVWNWNTTGITNMSNMFELTSFNKFIGSWDTSAVTTFSRMFYGATLYDRNINNWNVEAATDITDMFLGVTLSTSNYEGLLISWADQDINNLLSLKLNFSNYCSQEARTARFSLILNDSLTIEDAGLCEEGYFITTWKTDNQGSSNSTSITIPTYVGQVSDGSYFYQVDWNGDGDFDDSGENNNYTEAATHDYGTPGTYTVRIKGIYPQFQFDNGGDKDKLLTIEQWGTITWHSMLRAFYGASNVHMNANDTPDLSEATNLALMFAGTSRLGVSSGNWDWDTSSVTFSSLMFRNSDFNDDISNWNIENITDMSGMFENATLSNDNYDALLISWSEQNVNPNLIFDGGNSKFCSQTAQESRALLITDDNWSINDAGLDSNCDISNPDNHFVITLNTENVGTSGANFFTIPVTGDGHNYYVDANNDGAFDYTGVTGNLVINYATPGIKTIRISGDFPRIYFNDESDKDKILSIEQWGSIRWTSMNGSFTGASNLVVNATDTPDLSNVTSLFKMFKGATNLGNGSGNWNWDTSNISGMSQLFQDAINFNEDISSWNIENVSNVGGMFTGATLSDNNYDALLISWDSQNVMPSLVFNGGNSMYCSDKAVIAHASIQNNHLWTITDGGLNSNCDLIDLSLNISTTAQEAYPGDLVDYVIEIDNIGSVDAVNAIVNDILPLEFDGTTWSCSSSGAAFCPGSGSSQLNESVVIPVGTGLVYTVSATMTNTFFNDVEYLAQVSSSTSQTDANLNNNSDTLILENSAIFINGFESDPVIMKTIEGFVEYDFSVISKTNISNKPTAIIQGISEDDVTNLWIHVRKLGDQLQIRLSTRDLIEGLWSVGQWQTIDGNEVMNLYW